jgi:broad specificity phosphatase PhoE
MGRIIVVRHGQASYGQADYDRLSPRGVRQCELLGAHWAARGLRIDEVHVGPRRRHWQSHDASAAHFRAGGGHWPDPVEDPGLDEYSAFEVMESALPSETLKSMLVDTEASRREYFLLFRKTMRLWVRGELATPGVESWQQFRRRVEGSAERMRQSINSAADGKNIAVFTSGGPTAAFAGYALGLDDLRTMELSWIISNGSFSELLASRNDEEERFTLLSLNAIPHLADPDLVTGA